MAPEPKPGELVTPGRQGHWIVSQPDKYEERIDPRTGAVTEVVCDGLAHTVYAPDGKTEIGSAQTRGKALELIRVGPQNKRTRTRTPKPEASEQ